MFKVKISIILFNLFFLFTSCSIINKVKEKLKSDKPAEQETTTSGEKEKTKSGSESDLNFYNEYIDVLNKISQPVEDMQKDYLNEVPDPKNLKKNSMIFAISSSIQVSSLESVIKEHKRSYYDNGELAKLTCDNAEMKKEIEEDFKSALTSMENYLSTAKKVIAYYQDKEYQTNTSSAAGYDDEMKSSYKECKESIDRLGDALKKYKPKKVVRNPDDYPNPDDKAVAVLLNTYENSLEKAEDFYDKFEKFKQGDDTQPIQEAINALDNSFQQDTKTVESTPFTDKTKYMKYSFEDYFTKTVNDFLKESRKFIDNNKNSKMNEKKFNEGYNDVVRYYNYMIDSYNSLIGTVNSFKSY